MMDDGYRTPVIHDPSSMIHSPMLTLSHISKSFGATLALDDVSFDAAAGEVHALLGENGAGKSTLVAIAAGRMPADRGESRVVSRERTPYSPDTSDDSRPTTRLSLVAQHFTSIPAFTVAENIALAAGWQESGKALGVRARETIARIGLPLDAEAVVETLSVQLRQRLEIVKAMASDPQILLLDEPTAVLAPREVTELLAMVRAFAARGGAVVFISHKLPEVFAVADRVTVLRQGRVTLTGRVAEQTPRSLALAMIGEAPAQPERVAVTPGGTRVHADGLLLRPERGGTPVGPITMECMAGEIVGIAAIEGNGQRELLRAMAGLPEITRVDGTLRVSGAVGFVPEDRTTEGIIPEFSLTENFVLGRVRERWMDWGLLAADCDLALAEYDVRGGNAASAASALSGGNQQKLIFARVLSRQPDVLVAEDPTRGLDLHAAAAIHARLRSAAANGAAVIVHSSDLDEILDLADRVLVMANGKLVTVPAGASRDVVGDAMLGLPTP